MGKMPEPNPTERKELISTVKDSEKIMACVSPSPLSERLVQTASRLAKELNSDWQAVYVELPGQEQLSPQQRDQLMHNLQLAEALGAKLFSLKGDSVIEALSDYARSQGITKIVAGRPLETRWYGFLKPSIADQLVTNTGDIDLYLVSNRDDRPQPSKKKRLRIEAGPWSAYLQSVGLVLAASLISALIDPYISSINLVMVYLLAVVIAAIYLGRGPSILASILGSLTFDFFFVPISYTFEPENTEYLITFVGLIIVSLMISHLATKARKQAETARWREAETAALYGLSRDLVVADGLDEISEAIVSNICQVLGCHTAIFLPDSNDPTQLKIISQSPDYDLEPEEFSLAAQAFARQRKIDWETNGLKNKTQFLPLQTSGKTLGVLGVRLDGEQGLLDPKEMWLLNAFTDQSALAIERALFEEKTRRLELLKAAEKLQTALLNSISHDLRTPLVSITGSLSTLLVDQGQLDKETQHSLIETAYEEAERLNNFVGNILQMTRIRAGAMRVIPKPCDVQDLVGSALSQLHRQIGERAIELDIPNDLPLIPVDFVLVVQVLYNLLDNAAKYSSAGSPIGIRVESSDDQVKFQILDRGFGIPTQDLPHVFDNFYRANRTTYTGGTGLGLSICKGIVEAHGGYIGADRRQGGGMIFTFTLPKFHSEEGGRPV